MAHRRQTKFGWAFVLMTAAAVSATLFSLIHGGNAASAKQRWTRAQPAGSVVSEGNKQTARYYTDRMTPLRALRPATAAAVREWRFDAGLPAGWKSTALRLEKRHAGVQVVTSEANFAYQIRSQAFALPPGWYFVTVDGAVSTGGLALGVLERRRTLCVANEFYSAQQRPMPGRAMTAIFHVRASAPLQITFENWTSPKIAQSSTWLLRRVAIEKLSFLDRPDVRDFYERAAQPLEAEPSAAWPSVRSWGLSTGLPKNWSLGPAARSVTTQRGLEVTTNSGKSDYQIVSERFTLTRGRYAVFLTGIVTAGGINLAVLDTKEDRLVGQGLYWWLEAEMGRRPMWRTFRVPDRRTLQIVLSNWTSVRHSSQWALRGLVIRRVPD